MSNLTDSKLPKIAVKLSDKPPYGITKTHSKMDKNYILNSWMIKSFYIHGESKNGEQNR
jgi:hypothetical protein